MSRYENALSGIVEQGSEPRYPFPDFSSWHSAFVAAPAEIYNVQKGRLTCLRRACHDIQRI